MITLVVFLSIADHIFMHSALLAVDLFFVFFCVSVVSACEEDVLPTHLLADGQVSMLRVLTRKLLAELLSAWHMH